MRTKHIDIIDHSSATGAVAEAWKKSCPEVGAEYLTAGAISGIKRPVTIGRAVPVLEQAALKLMNS